MADKEMRIKVRVDNSDYTSKMKDMEGTQSRLGKSTEQTTGIFGKFFNKLSGGAGLANSSMLGLGRSFLSTSVGFGTLTALLHLWPLLLWELQKLLKLLDALL